MPGTLPHKHAAVPSQMPQEFVALHLRFQRFHSRFFEETGHGLLQTTLKHQFDSLKDALAAFSLSLALTVYAGDFRTNIR
jgi:hypothetical protein